jgi:hypothetical protein
MCVQFAEPFEQKLLLRCAFHVAYIVTMIRNDITDASTIKALLGYAAAIGC